MFKLRKSEDRGFADHGWLKAKHTFSFASYFDPEFTGFRDLKVINQDIVSPKMGFNTHPHKDMEIITYVISGTIKHKDSLGNEYEISEGEMQVMSAGTGVSHSEFNPSDKDDLELMQIWVSTDRLGHAPSYDQFKLKKEDKLNTLKLVVEPHDHQTKLANSAALKIHQSVCLYASILEENDELNFEFDSNRYGWIQLISGELVVATLDTSAFQGGFLEEKLRPGDGLEITCAKTIRILASKTADFLLFDLN